MHFENQNFFAILFSCEVIMIIMYVTISIHDVQDRNKSLTFFWIENLNINGIILVHAYSNPIFCTGYSNI